jgi:hypothetical protein
MAAAAAYRAVGQRVLTALTREKNMNRKVFLPSPRAAAVCAVLVAHIAMANPVVCSPGYYDATCNGRIAAAYQTPPSCSTGPGWTTQASAQWQGSHFSSPQCNYQAPPQCQSGWQTTSSPSWNGSSWVGLSCQPPPPPTNPCQYGFASGPTWNGSAWTYSCNAAPAVTCASQAQSQGYTLTNQFGGRQGPFNGPYTKFDGSYGSGTYYQYEYGATGPTQTTTCGDTYNTYIMYCPVSPTDGSAIGQLTGSGTAPGCAGGGN